MAGDDEIRGNGGNDVLSGDDGHDSLSGGQGDDLLIGGSGNDTMHGGEGNDTYRFSVGFGKDVLRNYNDDADHSDVVEFIDIDFDQAQLSRQGESLCISFANDDELTVADYFTAGTINPLSSIQEIRFNDRTLVDNDVTDLVRQASNSDELMHGSDDDDNLAAQGGDDELFGYGGNDTLDGGSGHDKLYGGDGDDILIGGTGNDSLYGNGGNNIYRFASGFGNDEIITGPASDDHYNIIDFSDLTAEQVTVQRDERDLVFVDDNGYRVTVRGYYNYNGSVNSATIQEVHFSDNTIWRQEDLVVLGNLPTEGDDELHATDNNNVLAGLGGDDHLIGSDGADIIIGGRGNDYLEGQDGADTYRFSMGDGRDFIRDYNSTSTNHHDVIELTDITPEQVSLEKDGSKLVINILGGDRITVLFHFSSGTATDGTYLPMKPVINEIRFSDDTSWDATDITRYATMVGGSGDDTLNGDEEDNILTGHGGADHLSGHGGDDHLLGGEGRDTLYGGAGDDTLDGGAGGGSLIGEAGNDLYLFGKGAGRVVISNNGGLATDIDVVDLADFTMAEASYGRYSNSLVIDLGEGDELHIYDFFTDTVLNDDLAIKEIRFADGNADFNAIFAQVNQATAGDDLLVTSSSGGIMDGGAGQDTIYGLEGDDILIGGAGNDRLYGGGGDDIYRFSQGSGEDDDIYNRDSEGYDVIEFTDLTAEQVELHRPYENPRRFNSDHLVITTINGDRITLINYFSGTGINAEQKISEIRFSDGGSWGETQIWQMINPGTAHNDYLIGGDGADNLAGQGGDDGLFGNDGNDQLSGGDGDDDIFGGVGDDLLEGGAQQNQAQSSSPHH